MLRQIIAHSEPSLLITLPQNMVGKKIEVIAFEIEDESTEVGGEALSAKAQRLNEIRTITKNTLVDLSNFKFDRDEANNYEE